MTVMLAGREISPILRNLRMGIDEETGLQYRVLFAQGLLALKLGELVVVTNNRFGVSLGGKNGELARGGQAEFGIEVDASGGRRRAEGKFAGVMLNADHELARPKKPGEKCPVSIGRHVEVFKAVTSAYLALVRAENEGSREECLNQEQLDAVIDWVITAG